MIMHSIFPIPNRRGLTRLAALILAASLWACGGSITTDGDLGEGGAASSAGNGSNVSSNASGPGTTGAGGTSATSSTTTAGGAVTCVGRAESACRNEPDCVPLYHWLDVFDNSGPPPPPTPVEDPCCPECSGESCATCHVETYSYCVHRSDCGAPLPDGICGFPQGNCP